MPKKSNGGNGKTIGHPRSIRFWADNAARLDYAQKIGLNASEIVNAILQAHLKTALEELRQTRIRDLQSTLADPVP